ncbi:MAG: hypothetical protein ACJ764_03475 [Solirubrobacteraceae bacterium]
MYPNRRSSSSAPANAASLPTLSLVCSVGLLLAVAALAGTVGADARWLAALGHLITTRHAIPAGVPFAPEASVHWPNVPVLAELVFNRLERLMGDRGLMLAQLLAVAVALGVLIRDSISSGAEKVGTSRALLVAGLGIMPALAIARSQLFSLALFPLLCWLLRAEGRDPSRRIWLVVPLVALWSNLHGAVLVGLVLLLVYLVLVRVRTQPVVAVLVALASLAAVCATPALLQTVAYYHHVLTNQAAASGQGMWGALSLSSPLDVLFVLCALTLIVQFVRGRPELWERVGAAGLAAITLVAARNGVWLALFLAPVAARSFAPRRQWPALIVPLSALSMALLVFAVARGPVLRGAGAPLLARAILLAHGSPVLASAPIAEQVALDGGHIVAGNPIDAFPARTQQAYLEWLAGRPTALRHLDPGVRVVLVPRRSVVQRLMAATAGFSVAGQDPQVLLYERRG